jgi:hypothetical protein
MRARGLLPLFGVLAVGLVVTSFVVIGETPDTDDPASKIAAFYTAHDSDMQAGGVILMIAAAAFLAWAVQARSLLFLAEGGSATRATMGLVGSAVFAVGIAIFAGLNFALGDVPEKLDPATIQGIHVLSEDLFPPLAVGTTITLFGFGLATLATRALPVWLGWLAVVGGVFAITPLWFVPFIALGVFIIVSSVLMATRPAVVVVTHTDA